LCHAILLRAQHDDAARDGGQSGETRTGDAVPFTQAVSYTTLGQTGCWIVSICIEHLDTPHDGMIASGNSIRILCEKPDARTVIAALHDAMVDPEYPEQTGPPHRPLQLFIAYRLKGSFEEIQQFCGQCQIACELEDKESAKRSAKQIGTEYKGRNDRACRRCAGCEIAQTDGFDHSTLRKCSGCHEVWYHSRECQKAHWPEHKSFCKAVQRRAKAK